MPQRPTAGHIIILFNAAGFVWPWQPDFLTELEAAGIAAAMLLSSWLDLECMITLATVCCRM